MHTVKSPEHRYRVIAPQSSVAPNDVLRYAHNPAGHTRVAAVDKFPTAQVFVSCGRARLIRIVIRTPTEFFFVTIFFSLVKKVRPRTFCRILASKARFSYVFRSAGGAASPT